MREERREGEGRGEGSGEGRGEGGEVPDCLVTPVDDGSGKGTCMCPSCNRKTFRNCATATYSSSLKACQCTSCVDGFTGTAVATRGCPTPCPGIPDCLVTPVDDGKGRSTCMCPSCGISTFRSCATATYSSSLKACECTSCLDGFTGLDAINGCPISTCTAAANVHCLTCDTTGTTHHCLVCLPGYTGTAIAIATSGCTPCPTISHCLAGAAVDDGTGSGHCVCNTCDPTSFSSCHTAIFSVTDNACECTSCVDGFTGLVPASGCPTSTCTEAANVNCLTCDTSDTGSHGCLVCIDGFTGNAVATYGCPSSTCYNTASINCGTCNLDTHLCSGCIDGFTGLVPAGGCPTSTCYTTASVNCKTCDTSHLCTSCVDGFTGLVPSSGCPTSTCTEAANVNCLTCDTSDTGSHGCLVCIDGFTGNAVATYGCPISTCSNAASVNCATCDTTGSHHCLVCIDGFTGSAIVTSGCPTSCPAIPHCTAGAAVDDGKGSGHCVCITCDPTSFSNCHTTAYSPTDKACECTSCVDGFTGLVPSSGCPTSTCTEAANVNCLTCDTSDTGSHGCLICDDGFAMQPYQVGYGQVECIVSTCYSAAKYGCAVCDAATHECTKCVVGYTGPAIATSGCPNQCSDTHCRGVPFDDGTGTGTCKCAACDPTTFTNCLSAAYSGVAKACQCTACLDGYTGLTPSTGCTLSTCYHGASANCLVCGYQGSAHSQCAGGCSFGFMAPPSSDCAGGCGYSTKSLCTRCMYGYTGKVVASIFLDADGSQLSGYAGCPYLCNVPHCHANAAFDEGKGQGCLCTKCDTTTFNNCESAHFNGLSCVCDACVAGFTGLNPSGGCVDSTCSTAASVNCATCDTTGTTHHCLVCLPGYTGTAIAIATSGCTPCPTISHCLAGAAVDDGTGSGHCVCNTCDPTSFGDKCKTIAYSIANNACECTSCVDGFTGLVPASGCSTPTCFNAASLNCKTCDTTSHQCKGCIDGFTGTAIATTGCTPCPTISHCLAGAAVDDGTGSGHCVCNTCDPTSFSSCHTAIFSVTDNACECTSCVDGFTGLVPASGCPISTCYNAANVNCATCDTGSHHCLGCVDGFTGNSISPFGCLKSTCAAAANVNCLSCDTTGTKHRCLVCKTGYTGTANAPYSCAPCPVIPHCAVAVDDGLGTCKCTTCVTDYTLTVLGCRPLATACTAGYEFSIQTGSCMTTINRMVQADPSLAGYACGPDGLSPICSFQCTETGPPKAIKLSGGEVIAAGSVSLGPDFLDFGSLCFSADFTNYYNKPPPVTRYVPPTVTTTSSRRRLQSLDPSTPTCSGSQAGWNLVNGVCYQPCSEQVANGVYPASYNCRDGSSSSTYFQVLGKCYQQCDCIHPTGTQINCGLGCVPILNSDLFSGVTTIQQSLADLIVLNQQQSQFLAQFNQMVASSLPSFCWRNVDKTLKPLSCPDFYQECGPGGCSTSSTNCGIAVSSMPLSVASLITSIVSCYWGCVNPFSGVEVATAAAASVAAVPIAAGEIEMTAIATTAAVKESMTMAESFAAMLEVLDLYSTEEAATQTINNVVATSTASQTLAQSTVTAVNTCKAANLIIASLKGSTSIYQQGSNCISNSQGDLSRGMACLGSLTSILSIGTGVAGIFAQVGSTAAGVIPGLNVGLSALSVISSFTYNQCNNLPYPPWTYGPAAQNVSHLALPSFCEQNGFTRYNDGLCYDSRVNFSLPLAYDATDPYSYVYWPGTGPDMSTPVTIDDSYCLLIGHTTARLPKCAPGYGGGILSSCRTGYDSMGSTKKGQCSCCANVAYPLPLYPCTTNPYPIPYNGKCYAVGVSLSKLWYISSAQSCACNLGYSFGACSTECTQTCCCCANNLPVPTSRMLAVETSPCQKLGYTHGCPDANTVCPIPAYPQYLRGVCYHYQVDITKPLAFYHGPCCTGPFAEAHPQSCSPPGAHPITALCPPGYDSSAYPGACQKGYDLVGTRVTEGCWCCAQSIPVIPQCSTVGCTIDSDILHGGPCKYCSSYLGQLQTRH